MARGNRVGSHSQVDAVSEQWEEPQDPKLFAVVAAAAVALVSAYLWKAIAMATQYEVGVVAWAIGGAVGLVAVMMGSVGIRTGILCGVLALGAILGGNYWVQVSMMDQIVMNAQTLVDEQELEGVYEEYGNMARHFAEDVHTDAEIRQFMLDYDMTTATRTQDISAEELAQFKETDAQDLRAFAANPVTASELINAVNGDMLWEASGYSVWDAVIQSLGPMDYAFFFLGIGTAFRLGSRGRAY